MVNLIGIPHLDYFMNNIYIPCGIYVGIAVIFVFIEHHSAEFYFGTKILK